MTYQAYLEADRATIEAWLSACFRGHGAYGQLYDAMEYSLLAGGKRIRPVLTLETCRMCGGDVTWAVPFACALEMVHTYSLIHDDLPCMDDDDLRRGKPTSHKVFGESTAVLAGDALLTAAFETMTAKCSPQIPPVRIVSAVKCLSNAAGPAGMVGGQALDIDGEGKRLTADELKTLQSLKTGALISAAAEIGCIVAGGTDDQRFAVRLYAERLGLAFQIRDDMLDVVGETVALGKQTGSDEANQKSTFVTTLGLAACGDLVELLTQQAVAALDCFPDSEFHRQLAKELAKRVN